MFGLGKCTVSCITFSDLSSRVSVLIETDKNLNVFNIITKINQLKTLTKKVDITVNMNLMKENVI